MKKIIFLLIITLSFQSSFSQKKEKIKGSKIVVIQTKKVEHFTSLQVEDNLEVFLIKGNESGVEIEADNNLQEIIVPAVVNGVLNLSTTKYISSAKIVKIRVTYTEDFNLVTARGESKISTLADLVLDNIEFRSFDSTELFLNAKPKNFTVKCDDKSKVEMNIKADNCTIIVSKGSRLKALVVSNEMHLDLYQKAEATVEGDVAEGIIRLDNDTELKGKNLINKHGELICEASTKAVVVFEKSVTITASGKSEVELYGEPVIDLKKFADSAVLRKKPTK